MRYSAYRGEEMSRIYEMHEDGVSSVPLTMQGKRYLHVYRSRRDNVGQRSVCDWSGLVERLKTPSVSAETQTEFVAMGQDEQGRLKDVGGYIAGVVDGSRNNNNVKSRWLVALDIDEATQGTVERVEQTLRGIRYLIHSTRRSTESAPRYRVLIPLLHSVPPKQWNEVSLYMEQMLRSGGVTGVDAGSHNTGRFMYFPSVSSDQMYYFAVHDGAEVDGEAIVAVQVEKKAYGDPRRKTGYIGAFCTAYSISEAIAEFIPTVYTRRGERRYEYSGSTSGTAGVYVFEDDLGMYSHHDSDPLRGKGVNAYDMVLTHAFGGDKQKMHAMCESNERVMQSFAYEAVKVEKDDAWMQTLKRDEDGRLVKNVDNITKILLNDEDICNGIKYNEFHERVDIVGKLPWKTSSDEWSDEDQLRLIGWLERKYGIYAKEKTEVSLAEFFGEKRYNPLIEYLDKTNVVWDGVRRAEEILVHYLGAEDTPYTRACTRIMLLGAVYRAYQPGCKFDYVVCLLSRQGAGKSTLLNKLGGAYYSDSIGTMEGIEAYEALRGVWIAEVAELSAKRKSTTEAVKKFITSQVDRYRPKYGRIVKSFPRRNIFVATTNDAQMLNDATGGRRFLPVECQGTATGDVHTMDDAVVEQIWGEVVSWYKEGERCVLSKDMETAAEGIREHHTDVGMITETVLAFLDKPITDNWYKLSLHERQEKLGKPCGMCTHPRKFISMREIWKEALEGEGETPSYDVRREINTAMNFLRAKGWTRATHRLGRQYGDKPVTGLKRPE
jgi:predicted P-loop ATPase